MTATCFGDDVDSRGELLDLIDGLEVVAARHLTAELDLESVIKSGDVSDDDYKALDETASDAADDYDDAVKPEQLLYLCRLFRDVVGGAD